MGKQTSKLRSSIVLMIPLFMSNKFGTIASEETLGLQVYVNINVLLFLLGVTIRNRADYNNLKVTISMDSMSGVSLW